MKEYLSANWIPQTRVRRWLFTILLVGGLFPASAVVAGDTLFLVDTSAGMSARCGGAGKRYIDLAQERLQRELQSVDADSHVGLIVFSASANVAQPLTRDHQKLRQKKISASALKLGKGALSQALDLAASQGRRGKGKPANQVLIISRAEALTQRGRLLQQIAMLQQHGNEIRYINIGTPTPESANTLNTLFKDLDFQACAGSRRRQAERSTIKIQRLAARLSGMPISLFGLDTDFVDQLGMDRLTAYEILSAATAEAGVVTPQRGHFTTVRAIAEYLQRAPANGSKRPVLRGGKRSGEAKSNPVLVKKVFFATDRKRTRKRAVSEVFTGERAAKGKISYGQCEVTIPVRRHKRGVLESPLFDYLADPTKHVLLKKVSPLERRQFFKLLQKTLAAGNGKGLQSNDMLVFIHGFNVTFEEAARRSAQVAYDLDFKGVPLFFSWPSNGQLYAYISDREDVAWSVPHIAQFLKDLVQRAGGGKIHIIAHSMGHEGLLRALQYIALEQRGKGKKTLFENVIMAAPDFDAEIFSEEVGPEINRLSRNWTLYASDKDMALNVSASLRFADRLGVPLTLLRDVVTVDATGVEVTPWSVPEFHSYYATKQRVIDDISAVLKGRRPAQRALSKAKRGRLNYWKLLTVGAR